MKVEINKIIWKKIADGTLHKISTNSIIGIAWQNNISVAELNIIMPNREKDFFDYVWSVFSSYITERLFNESEFSAYGFAKKIHLMLGYGADFFEDSGNKNLLRVLSLSTIRSTYRISSLRYVMNYTNLILNEANDLSVDFNYYTKRSSIFIIISLSFLILLTTKNRSKFNKATIKMIEQFKQIPKIRSEIINNIKKLKSLVSRIANLTPFMRLIAAFKFNDNNNLIH